MKGLDFLRAPSVRSVESMAEAHHRIRQSFKNYAARIDHRRKYRSGYLSELVRRYRFYVEPGARVLELGVGSGDLLASLNARQAVGVDISPEMLEVARSSHPELELHETAAEDLRGVEGPFDYLILSDLTVFLYEIHGVLMGLHRLCHPRTRIIFNFHSRLWQPVLRLLAVFGLHHHHERTNWVTVEDLVNLLLLANFEVVKTDRSTLFPARLPGIAHFLNKYLCRLPVLNHLCLVNWLIARPRVPLGRKERLSVSIVCPCRNEAGNVENIVNRIPLMGKHTELIFVEGGSSDRTWEAIQEQIATAARNSLEIKAYKQGGKGKGDAVRVGFSHARGDILMILDADLSVMPEALAVFFQAIADGKGEFINGSRLVYPMNERAMRFFNLLGNKFFAWVYSYLIDQTIKDTLCGTKVISREDYERLDRGRHYFGDLDPYGDFDLLFGAAKLNLRIIEIPVRYRERAWGETNIHRFRDGFLLLRMCWFGLSRLKWV